MNPRYLPIHLLVPELDKIDENFCLTIIAAHNLTGSDCTSKVGTKLKAIQADPQNYLVNFGFGKFRSIKKFNNKAYY